VNYPDADRLASLITRNWRNGLNPEIWCERFENDYSSAERARAVIIKLTREKIHAPSLAEFHSAYLATPDPDATKRNECRHCNSTGWLELEGGKEHHSHAYDYMTPCTADKCEWSAQARRIHAKINAERAA